MPANAVLGFPVPPPLSEDEAARVHAVRCRACAFALALVLSRALSPHTQLREALRLDALPPASPAARYCTDACLCRYLRARAWDVAKATKMLDASLHWRSAVAIEALRFQEVAPEAATGKMQRLDCADRAGRPVLLMRPGCENTSVAAGQLRFLQWTMEDMARHHARAGGSSLARMRRVR
jgi:hypothetical protein